MGGLDRLAFLMLIMMALWAFFGEEREGAAPPPAPRAQSLPFERQAAPPPAVLAPLPPPSPRDPVFEVIADGPGGGTSTGTAFSVNAQGLWLTARHVVQGCGAIGLRERQRWVRATVAWAHPNADVALLRTQNGSPPLALSESAPLRGMDGYGMGFPQGRPGAVHGRLLGRAQMQARGLFQGRAPTLEWAEVRRAPSFRGSLGGISGGPLLDGEGRVLGVMVAEEPRRGRFSTAAPETLLAMAGPNRPIPLGAARTPPVPVTPGGFGAVADQLRGRLSIAQVLCQAR